MNKLIQKLQKSTLHGRTFMWKRELKDKPFANVIYNVILKRKGGL